MLVAQEGPKQRALRVGRDPIILHITMSHPRRAVVTVSRVTESSCERRRAARGHHCPPCSFPPPLLDYIPAFLVMRL